MHRPILLKDITLSFSGKICFEGFTTQIQPGSRIAIIGRNGSGKSSLLNILRKTLSPTEGDVIFSDDVSVGFVEQTISDFNTLSGGQRLNKRLSEALAQSPDMLLLDEPTNHLDKANRKSLMHMMNRFPGTLIVVSHDTELLRTCIDTLWHIDQHAVHTFSGTYDDYLRHIQQKRTEIEKALSSLKREKKSTHDDLMKEQERAAHSKRKGEKSIHQKKWPTVVSQAKARRAEQTSGKKKSTIYQRKKELTDQLSGLHRPKVILPTFSLTADNIATNNIVSITNADIGYSRHDIILNNIALSLAGNERIAIEGENASGKSTLLKAILMDKSIFKTGDWHLPSLQHIGYLDQHYANLNPALSMMEHVQALRPDWCETQIRHHLSDFLFFENETVTQPIVYFSGGEKARAALSLIAAKTPKLLILDEITNNIDLETKTHVTQVLKAYPGALIMVSHEADFIQTVGVDHVYTISEGRLQ